MSGTGTVPGRTLGQLLIAEPAVTPEGRLTTWLAQFLVRLSGFVGPAGGNAPAGSLAAGVAEALEAVVLGLGQPSASGGANEQQIQSLQAAVGRVPLGVPLVPPSTLAPLPLPPQAAPLLPRLPPPQTGVFLPALPQWPAQATFLRPLSWYVAGVVGTYGGNPLWQCPITENTILPVNLRGSFAACVTAPTGAVSVNILKNGGVIGTMNFAAAATTGTFTVATEQRLVPGDVLAINQPGAGDATWAGPSWSIAAHVMP